MKQKVFGIGMFKSGEFIRRAIDNRERILDYFKDKNNLLVVNWEKGDGWKEICNFLGHDIPNAPFPHKNKGFYK